MTDSLTTAGQPPATEGPSRSRRHLLPHPDHAGPRYPGTGRRLRWWRELLYIVVFYVVYSFVRNLFGSQGTGDDIDPTVAFEHANQIIDAQRSIGLYFEHHLQAWYLDLPSQGFIRLWNIFYGTLHFIVTPVALIWAYRKDHDRYARWRNTLALTTTVALVGFATYSLMPPRLLDDPGRFGACQIYAPEAAAAAPPGEKQVDGCDRYGYVDTIVEYGGWISFDAEEAAAVTNQYAAMPSMHIGWSTWSMLVMLSLLRRRWLRALVVTYPLVTLFCIMVTANHFWLDAVGGLAALSFGLFSAWHLTAVIERRQARRASPETAPA